MKFNADEFRKINKQDRLWFVDYWAEYVKTHSDKEWSRQQNVLINSQLQSAKHIKLNRKDYLKVKSK